MTYTPNTIYSFLHTTTITEIIYDGDITMLSRVHP